MKTIVFDASPIISLTMNNLLWLLEPLQKSFGGEFLMTNTVKGELVDKPLTIKKFEFEALQVQKQINQGILKVVYEEGELKQRTLSLLELANHCFKAKGEWISIVQYGEISTLALAIITNADAMVVDERTTRQLVENPKRLQKIMEKHLHTRIETNKKNIREFQQLTKNVKIIRSSELVTIAFEKGLLQEYLTENVQKKTLLDAILWGVKLDGCAITKNEIEQIIKMERV